jgi:hypothetical protein
MTKSFTIFLVLLAATLSLTTADMFNNYMIRIIQAPGYTEADCKKQVEDAIDDVLQLCVAQADPQANPPYPSIPTHRKKYRRRRALSTTSSVSRQLVCTEGTTCVEACALCGIFCSATGNNRRRLEDLVLAEGYAAAASVTERELTPADWNNKIEGKCRTAVRNYAQENANNHNCLGTWNNIEVEAYTSV